MPSMSLSKKALIAGISLIAVLAVAVPAFSASQPRDYNSNAVIYGGAYYDAELINIVNSGVNRDGCAAKGLCPHQTSAELKALYKAVGMDPGWFGQLQSGTIYRNGDVELNGKIVAHNVQTMGRHNLAGSTPFTALGYPLYWRNPSVSFNSNSIPAWIFMNYDGTMGFGIVKSCGNPIKAAGVKVKPTPKFTLTVKKFEDKDGDKVKDASESMLSGWKFVINGNNVKNKEVTTDKNGQVTLTNLENGAYTVKELTVSGWNCTTGVTRTITINGKNVEVWFGNKRQPVTPSATYSIVAKKFEDDDADGVKDGDEPYLAGWSIKLTKNGDSSVDRTFQTDEDGEVIFTNLSAGTYTVSEIMQDGWKNITPINQTVSLPSATGADPEVDFGNQKIKTVVPQGEITPTPTPLPVSGPVDAVAGTFGIVGMGGAGAYYLKGKKALLSALKKLK